MQDIMNWILNKDRETLNKVYKPLVETYKQVVPANARMYIKNITNPTPVTENNFTKKELDVLTKVYKNSSARSQNSGAKKLYNAIKNEPEGSAIRLINNGQTTIAPVEQLMQQVSPSIQYNDYGLGQGSDVANIGKNAKQQSIAGSPYSLMTTIGRANYSQDNQGNTHITDTYNFNKTPEKYKKEVKDNTKGWDKDYRLLRQLGEVFGGKMPVDINLGKGY